MLNSRYWYTDNEGKVQKYIYCRLCLAGPFKLDEVDKKFVYHGPKQFLKKCEEGINTEPYCFSCSELNNHFKHYVTETFMTGSNNPNLKKMKPKKASYIHLHKKFI